MGLYMGTELIYGERAYIRGEGLYSKVYGISKGLGRKRIHRDSGQGGRLRTRKLDIFFHVWSLLRKCSEKA